MGNFTRQAFIRKVSAPTRRRMADHAYHALDALGAAVPWPLSSEQPKLEPDLPRVLVRLYEQLVELAVELRRSGGAVAADPAARLELEAIARDRKRAREASRAPTLEPSGAPLVGFCTRAAAAATFAEAVRFVSADLVNTIAGDRHERGAELERLRRLSVALPGETQRLVNLFHDLTPSKVDQGLGALQLVEMWLSANPDKQHPLVGRNLISELRAALSG